MNAGTPPIAGTQARLGDLWGGLAAMLVALPSAIAFGVLVFTAIGPGYAGAGATAGALGAAVLGMVAPLVGRNGGFITAPCAPAAAVMSGIAIGLGAGGDIAAERVVGLMVLTALISAALQVTYGALRLGRFMKFIPYQVVSGYLSGVAVIIAAGQLPKLLGLPGGTGLFRGLISPHLWQWPGIVVGCVTIAVTFAAPRFIRVVPSVILGLVAGLMAYFTIGLAMPDLLTVTDNALVIGPITADGSLWHTLAQNVSSLMQLEVGDVKLVLAGAATLSVLLSIDTLKTGVVLDALTRSRNNSNRELLGQGVGNVCAALTGGMPGAGTMGPTLVNVTSGGRSPLSGFAAGALALLVFLLLRPALAWIPIGALAGILLVVAWKMFDWSLFRLLLNPATRLDFAVILAVIVVAKGVGLIQASVVGIVLAILLFIRDQARSSVIRNKRDLRSVSSTTTRPADLREVLDERGDQGLLVELQDNLFFGTTDQLLSDLADDLQARQYILFDLRRIQSLDYTAGHLLNRIQEQLQERKGRLLLAGMPSSLPTGESLEKYLRQLGVLSETSGIMVFETRNAALEWMEERIIESSGHAYSPGQHPLELHEIELFREFDENALQAVRSIAQSVALKAGDRPFSRGDVGDELYLIQNGAVEISLPLAEGMRHHLATVSRGGYFGEMAFLDKGARSADAVAKTDTTLLVLSRQRFNEIAHADAIVATKVFARLASLLARRLRTTNIELRTLEKR